MYRFIVFFIVLTSYSQSMFAQSQEERTNRAMYNRIEYFFNTKQPDSIYNLASDLFKKQVSQDQLATVLQQLYALGKINNGELIKYEKGIAGYKIDFNSESLLLILGLDSTFHYGTLVFQPYSAPKEDKKEPVISQVEKVNPLDFAVDSIAKIYVQKNNAQSLSIAIIHQNQIKKYFYGEISEGNNILPDENTIYEIGSITKTFTATLLADLVQREIIKLDDTITKFLPDSVAQNPALQKITFKSLANHTSGLPRLPSNLMTGTGFDPHDPYAHYNRKALFEELKHIKPTRDPEIEYEYSNLGYGLLGELMAIISNKPYLQCIEDIITTPLHMDSTSGGVDRDSEQVARAYKDGKEVAIWDFDALAGTGTLKSTVNDLLRYAITQLAMPETELQYAMAATKLFTYFIPPNTDIGLAWHMNIVEDMTYYWHNGGTGGSSSFIAIIPDNKSAVIVLSNANLPVDQTASDIIEKVITLK